MHRFLALPSRPTLVRASSSLVTSVSRATNHASQKSILDDALNKHDAESDSDPDVAETYVAPSQPAWQLLGTSRSKRDSDPTATLRDMEGLFAAVDPDRTGKQLSSSGFVSSLRPPNSHILGQSDLFRQDDDASEDRAVRRLTKKLRQIEKLEQRERAGEQLLEAERAKLGSRAACEAELEMATARQTKAQASPKIGLSSLLDASNDLHPVFQSARPPTAAELASLVDLSASLPRATVAPVVETPNVIAMAMGEACPAAEVVVGKLRMNPGAVLERHRRTGHSLAVVQGCHEGRPAAVRCFAHHPHSRHLASSDAPAAVERERELMMRHRHPLVAQYYGAEESGGQRFLAHEHTGVTLEDLARSTLTAPIAPRVAEPKSADPAKSPASRTRASAASIMRDMVEVVSFLHKRGVVHRDLSPQSFIVAEEGGVKLGGMRPAAYDLECSCPSDALVDRHDWVPHVPANCAACDVRALGLTALAVLARGPNVRPQTTASRTLARAETPIAEGEWVKAALASLPREAFDLLERMISPASARRPTLEAARGHPLLMTEMEKMDYLHGVVSRVRSARGAAKQGDAFCTAFVDILTAGLQRGHASAAVWPPSGWRDCLDPAVIGELGSHRSYMTDSVLDLIFFTRNLGEHVAELTPAPLALLYQAYLASEGGATAAMRGDRTASLPAPPASWVRLLQQDVVLQKKVVAAYVLPRFPDLVVAVYRAMQDADAECERRFPSDGATAVASAAVPRTGSVWGKRM